MKTCSHCKQEKSFDFFGKRKTGSYNSLCKECNSKKATEWAKQNKEKRKIISQRYRLANPEKCRESVKKSQQKNPERIKKWVDSNKEKVSKYKEKWRALNKGKIVSLKHKRRGAPGGFSENDIKKLMKLQRNRCACCTKDISVAFHRDHIMPIAKGGSNDASNIQLLCPECNRRKSAKDPIDFMQEKGYLL